MEKRKPEEVGASATEYGLLAVAIAAILVVIVFAFGDVIVNLFTQSCDAVKDGASTSSTCE